jgi:hypothetical protein
VDNYDIWRSHNNMGTNWRQLTEEIPEGSSIKYVGLKVNLDKRIKKMSWKSGCMGKIKCNNHEVKEVESFKNSI